LRGEWNPVAVDLAKELKELKVHVKPVVASGWDGDLDPETLRDKLVQWRSDQRMSQRQASVMLKVSRGIIADIEVGRRKMSKQIWERIRSATS
jgi:predicted transcriptional regulator